MSKQVIPDKRKGMIPKWEREPEEKKVAKLTIDRPIDDISLWYVEIDEKGIKTRRPCKQSTLEESFKKGKTTWDVKVIGCWKNMSGNDYIQF